MGKTYKKNFLNQVVLKVDFEPIGVDILNTYQQKFKAQFGKVTNRKLMKGVLELRPDAGPHASSEQLEDIWIFEDEKKETKLEVSSSYVALVYSRYENSTLLRKDLSKIFATLQQDNSLRIVNRVGLRYINEISIPLIKRLEDWKKYIAEDLLVAPLRIQKRSAQTRFFSVSEFNNSDRVATGLRYGIWNEKYPSPITSSSYVLDIDCFTRQPHDLSEKSIEDVVKSLNEFSENVFEDSITEELRKVMREM